MHMRNSYATAVSLGGNTSKCGYSYLASSGEIIVGLGYFPRNELNEKVYKPVAAIYRTKPHLVAREIARAVEEIWEHGDRERLRDVLGHKIIDKPTPAEVMQALANYIAEGERVIM
ncbi:sporulation initiation factor Spo0A C-terminal domain-containing protein [Beduinella massiliensis]|uniref:sporulation initiation factor Spo0A C-terminal domain-containing protein n=1 Tax=Beduinella massiliensis TaxID=1852363 RepID=UPI000C824DD9